MRFERHSVCGSLLVISSTMALSACGNSGNSTDGQGNGAVLPLQGKSDVLREIGILNAGTDFVAISTGSDSLGALTAAGAKRSVNLALARQRVAPVRAKDSVASTQKVCSGGGSEIDTTGNTTRQFLLFTGQSVPVNYVGLQYLNCQEVTNQSSPGSSGNITTTTVQNGYEESGQSAATSSAGYDYAYSQLGFDNSPIEVVSTDTNASGGTTYKSDYSAIGVQEKRQNGSGLETRTIVDTLEIQTQSSGSTSGGFSLGSGSTPFAMFQTAGTETLSLIGPYSYFSEICGGQGGANVGTPVALIGSNDSSGYYVSGGTLTLAASSNTATVTYNGDGSATFQINNGATGTLTRSELQMQVNQHPCG